MSESIPLGPQPDPMAEILGTLPSDPRDRARFVSRMAQGESLAGPDAIGKPIDVHHWLIHPTEKVDDHTGEVTPSERLILADAAGNQVSTSSGVAVQAWKMIATALGNGPYDPPFRVVLREGKARGGNKFTTIVAVD